MLPATSQYPTMTFAILRSMTQLRPPETKASRGPSRSLAVAAVEARAKTGGRLPGRSICARVLAIVPIIALVIDAPLVTRAADATDTAPLPVVLPPPTVKGTPEDLPKGPMIEPLSDKKRPPFMAPKGVKNVALGKPVTSSVPPFTGELTQVTDGKKDPVDDDAVEMKRGTQWVQVDLGESLPIYAIVVWHDHRYIQIVHDVIVQVSDDPEFKTGVQTLFNNDTDNSSGRGAGADREYFETNLGKTVDAKGIKARYVRGYSKGSTSGGLNCWQEIEVYALPK